MRIFWTLVVLGTLMGQSFGQSAIEPKQQLLPDTISPATKAVLQSFYSAPAPDPALSIDKRREMAAALQDQIAKAQLQQYEVTVASGTIAGIPVRIFTPKEMAQANADRVLVNVHGGGFIIDSGSLSENIPIAALTKMKIISVLYRLAPENPFPAAVNDTVAVYRELLKTYRPAHIGLYGTSAGAILSAETVARLKKDGLPLPAAVGFFSGSADLSTTGDSELFLPGLDNKSVNAILKGYVANADLKDSLLSPLFSDLKGFPPTLCLSSTRDVLLSQTAIFHLALLRAGVDADLVVFEALPHAFWAGLPVAETREANEIIAKFFAKRLLRAPQ